MKMWTVLIRDQTARSVQSDLDLHCPQKTLVSPIVSKELNITYNTLHSVKLNTCPSELKCLTITPTDFIKINGINGVSITKIDDRVTKREERDKIARMCRLILFYTLH